MLRITTLSLFSYVGGGGGGDWKDSTTNKVRFFGREAGSWLYVWEAVWWSMAVVASRIVESM